MKVIIREKEGNTIIDTYLCDKVEVDWEFGEVVILSLSKSGEIVGRQTRDLIEEELIEII